MRPLLPEPGDPGLHITGDDKNTIIDDDNPHGSRGRRGHCLHFNRHVLVDEGPVGGALNKLSRLEGAATDDFERAIAAACSIFDNPEAKQDCADQRQKKYKSSRHCDNDFIPELAENSLPESRMQSVILGRALILDVGISGSRQDLKIE